MLVITAPDSTSWNTTPPLDGTNLVDGDEVITCSSGCRKESTAFNLQSVETAVDTDLWITISDAGKTITIRNLFSYNPGLKEQFENFEGDVDGRVAPNGEIVFIMSGWFKPVADACQSFTFNVYAEIQNNADGTKTY